MIGAAVSISPWQRVASPVPCRPVLLSQGQPSGKKGLELPSWVKMGHPDEVAIIPKEVRACMQMFMCSCRASVCLCESRCSVSIVCVLIALRDRVCMRVYECSGCACSEVVDAVF